MNTVVSAKESRGIEDTIAQARAAVAELLGAVHYVSNGVVPEADVFKELAEPIGVIAACLGAIEATLDRCYLETPESVKQAEVRQ